MLSSVADTARFFIAFPSSCCTCSGLLGSTSVSSETVVMPLASWLICSRDDRQQDEAHVLSYSQHLKHLYLCSSRHRFWLATRPAYHSTIQLLR